MNTNQEANILIMIIIGCIIYIGIAQVILENIYFVLLGYFIAIVDGFYFLYRMDNPRPFQHFSRGVDN